MKSSMKCINTNKLVKKVIFHHIQCIFISNNWNIRWLNIDDLNKIKKKIEALKGYILLHIGRFRLLQNKKKISLYKIINSDAMYQNFSIYIWSSIYMVIFILKSEIDAKRPKSTKKTENRFIEVEPLRFWKFFLGNICWKRKIPTIFHTKFLKSHKPELLKKGQKTSKNIIPPMATALSTISALVFR